MTSSESNQQSKQQVGSDDILIHDSVWSWPDASPGQRAIAFVLDNLILTGLYAFLGVLLSRVTDGGVPSTFQGIITILYFVLMHGKTGQTLGKKMVGIKVVALEPELAEQSIPQSRLFVRETVGRFLNVVLLGYGYLRILFRADRMGFHDSLARTRVISLGESTLPIKARHVFAVLSLLGLIGIGASYYTFYYTAYPLRQYARNLELNGFTVGRIEGNITRGFSVERISRESDDYSFEINGVNFRYENVGEGEEREFVVSDLSVSSARVELRKWPQNPKKASEPAPQQGPFGDAPRVAVPLTGLPASLSFKSIDLQNIDVTVPQRPTYKLKRLLVSDLRAKSKLRSFEVGQVYVDSETLMVNVEELVVLPKQIILSKPAYIGVRPGLYPEVLKANMDFQVEGVFEDFKPTKLKVSGLNQRLKATWDNGVGEISLNGFTPVHYLKTDLPLWNVDFRISGDFKGSKIDHLHGNVGVRNVRFGYEAASMVHRRGDKAFMLAPRLSADWRQMLVGRDPGLILGSTTKQTAREILSELYFSKASDKLSPQEKDIVDRDQRFFANTVDAGTDVPPTPMVSLRLPANSKRGPALGVPTKLPPYVKKKKSRR